MLKMITPKPRGYGRCPPRNDELPLGLDIIAAVGGFAAISAASKDDLVERLKRNAELRAMIRGPQGVQGKVGPRGVQGTPG
jgi:hypothetical protein